MNKSEGYQIAHYIRDFINVYCPQSKTISEHTIKSYKDAITLYLDFLESEKKVTVQKLQYDDFNSDTINDWLIWLVNTRNNSPQTANVRLSSIRAFIKYLAVKDRTLIYLNIEAKEIKKRRVLKNKVKGMSREAVKALANSISRSTLTGRRDFLIFVILYDTGIRIDELLSLQIKDLHLEPKKPYINIIGKGNKLRSLYLKQKTVTYLKKYLKEIQWTSNDNYLFYSRIKGMNNKMTEEGVSKQMKKWAKKAYEICREVPKNLHPHQIRHTTATHWLEDGMNIGEIQYLLGHENINTTMVYLEITIAQKAAAITSTMTTENENQSKNWIKDIKKLRDLCK